VSVVVSAALFCVGLYGVLTRRDLVAVLACVELMLGAATVQLVAFGAVAGRPGAAIESLALILHVLAAAEASVGLALVLAAMKRTGKGKVDELTEVNG
jgi:NADH:ubiquinone oxidoreductase subunit K